MEGVARSGFFGRRVLMLMVGWCRYGAQLVAVRLMEKGIKNIILIEKAGGFG